MGEGRRPGGQILVEAVDSVVARNVDPAGPHIAAVVVGLRDDLRGIGYNCNSSEVLLHNLTSDSWVG
jgi:hypothetical protein